MSEFTTILREAQKAQQAADEAERSAKQILDKIQSERNLIETKIAEHQGLISELETKTQEAQNDLLRRTKNVQAQERLIKAHIEQRYSELAAKEQDIQKQLTQLRLHQELLNKDRTNLNEGLKRLWASCTSLNSRTTDMLADRLFQGFQS